MEVSKQSSAGREGTIERVSSPTGALEQTVLFVPRSFPPPLLSHPSLSLILSSFSFLFLVYFLFFFPPPFISPVWDHAGVCSRQLLHPFPCSGLTPRLTGLRQGVPKIGCDWLTDLMLTPCHAKRSIYTLAQR